MSDVVISASIVGIKKLNGEKSREVNGRTFRSFSMTVDAIMDNGQPANGMFVSFDDRTEYDMVADGRVTQITAVEKPTQRGSTFWVVKRGMLSQTQRPRQCTPAPQGAASGPAHGRTSTDTSIRAQVAFKGAVEMAVAAGYGPERVRELAIDFFYTIGEVAAMPDVRPKSAPQEDDIPFGDGEPF